MKKPTEEELERARQFRDMAPEDKVFIVFRGVPKMFGLGLAEAEEWAAEQTALDHQDRTVLCVPRASVEYTGLVARYKGVVLSTLQEALEEENRA